MEANKADAEKCFEIARKLLANGNREKAKKFLNKSKKLYPLEKVETLLQNLNKLEPDANNVQNGHSSKTKRKEAQKTEEKTIAKEPDYSPEQLAEVQRINKLKDYYDILNVAKDASDEELKKSYRRLALLCHPDKNRAPGSTEAFKAIGNSFAILNDSDKRKRYDKFGHDGPQSINHHDHDHYQDFEADITPEDLFNMFFGGVSGNRVFIHRGFNNRHRTRHRHHHHDDDEHDVHQNNGVGSMMHLIPILIFIVLSLISSLLVQDPPYSFSSTGEYRLLRQTQKFRIPYYVHSDFSKHYEGKTLLKLEGQIEREYVSRLRSACYREQQIREDLLARGRFWRDKSLIDQANNFKMDSCNELQKIRNR